MVLVIWLAGCGEQVVEVSNQTEDALLLRGPAGGERVVAAGGILQGRTTPGGPFVIALDGEGEPAEQLALLPPPPAGACSSDYGIVEFRHVWDGDNPQPAQIRVCPPGYPSLPEYALTGGASVAFALPACTQTVGWIGAAGVTSGLETVDVPPWDTVVLEANPGSMGGYIQAAPCQPY